MARSLPHSTAAMVRQQFSVATLCFVTLTLSSVPVREIEAQRPLLNHTTYNTIPTGQHNYKLRNGRTHDFIIPPTTVASIPRGVLGSKLGPGVPIYDDLESTLLPPLNGVRRDSRRRLNLQAWVNMHGGGSSGRGMETLRKALAEPSVGGPGGGISGNSPGYPAYAATSSIGKIDGLGQVGPAQRYGDPLRHTASLYSTIMPPHGNHRIITD